MFDNFKKAVLADYEKKKESGDISENLLIPSRSKLRAECFIALDKHYKSEDDEILKQFFDPFNKYDSHKLSIQKFDGDGFKSIIDFFAGNVAVRKEENVKLLAWLINYEHRPYHPRWIDPTVPGGDKDSKASSEKLKFWQRPAFSSGISILTLVFFGYLIWQFNFNTSSSIPKFNQKCMYWNGNAYEAVACNVKTSSAKIPLDTAVLNQLKKINEPDTLTQQSIGKVWYGKVNGKPEFYAASGTHPLDANKRLMPLTNYMLTKYVSYHRYQLKMLIWSIGGLLIISVLTLLVFKFFAKRSVAKKA